MNMHSFDLHGSGHEKISLAPVKCCTFFKTIFDIIAQSETTRKKLLCLKPSVSND